MINIRKILSRKSDEALSRIHAEAQYPITMAEDKYRQEGSVSTELAQIVSESAEICTVAAAVIKERIESGDEGSHKRLHQSNVKASQKRIDRGWGFWLSSRRRV